MSRQDDAYPARGEGGARGSRRAGASDGEAWLRAAVLSAALSDMGGFRSSPATVGPPPAAAPAVAAAEWPWVRPLDAILRVSGRTLEEALSCRRAAAEVGLLWRLWQEGTGGERQGARLGA